MKPGAHRASLLRITGGNLKGRTIKIPPGIIRPAMDKMRESLFAVLGDLSGASFLDLFSGSGIISLEAASRGAAHLEAVESDKLKSKILISNAALSPVHIYCHFITAELFIKQARKKSFDYIFCDPPFDYRYKDELILNIGLSPLMGKTSLLMIHHPKKEKINLLNVQNILALKENRLYGNSRIDFFQKKT